jgi:hypothetical protein
MKKIKFNFTTPVLFMVFNRFDTTKQVFEEIKRAKPKQLFIASDGPRENKVGEKEKVEEIRKYILQNITWKCNIKTLFREKNLGCKYACAEAITWFFENVEQGIILEDDCLPSQSFFRFCQEILEKYKSDEKIMHICGTNVETESNISESYFFSNTFNVWGWATWRRAWENYDVNMKEWKKWRIKIFNLMKDHSIINQIRSWRIFALTYRGKIDTWDYQWIFHCLIHKGLCVIPKKNLVTNIGFYEGTHTTNYGNEKTLKKLELDFPLLENDIKIKSDYLKSYMTFFRPIIGGKK